MLFQPFFRITGRLKKVIDLVDLLFKQGQIFALACEILDHLDKGFLMFPLVIAVKDSLKDFILQETLLTSIL